MPILIGNSCRESERSFKYFIVQCVGSSIFLVGFCFSIRRCQRILRIRVAMVGLMVKLGFFPFHLWVPRVVAMSRWPRLFLLLVVQKLGPYWLIGGLGIPKEVFTVSVVRGVLTRVLGALGGLNQVYLRPMLGYSSLSHRGWMLPLCTLNFNMFIWYYLTYSVLISRICILGVNEETVESRFSLSIRLLSLGGLPPLAGRFIKKIALMCFVEFSGALAFILFISSLVRVCYYLWFFIYFSTFLKKDLDFTGSSWIFFHFLINALLGPMLFFWLGV